MLLIMNENKHTFFKIVNFKKVVMVLLLIFGAVVLYSVFQNSNSSDSTSPISDKSTVLVDNVANRVMPNIEYFANPSKLYESVISGLENVKTKAAAPASHVAADATKSVQKIVSYYARDEICQGGRSIVVDGKPCDLVFLNIGKGRTNNSETMVTDMYIVPYGHVPDFGPKGYHGYPETNKPFRVLGLKVVEENGEEKFYAHVYGNPFKVDVGKYTEHYGYVDDYIKVPRSVGKNIRKLIQGEKIKAVPQEENSKELWGAPSITQLEYEYIPSGTKD